MSPLDAVRVRNSRERPQSVPDRDARVGIGVAGAFRVRARERRNAGGVAELGERRSHRGDEEHRGVGERRTERPERIPRTLGSERFGRGHSLEQRGGGTEACGQQRGGPGRGSVASPCSTATRV